MSVVRAHIQTGSFHKVQIFWECSQNLKKISHFLLALLSNSKKDGLFLKFLLSSQNIWTLWAYFSIFDLLLLVYMDWRKENSIQSQRIKQYICYPGQILMVKIWYIECGYIIANLFRYFMRYCFPEILSCTFDWSSGF